MLDPTQQLMMARGMLAQQAQQPMGSAFASEVERNAASITAGITNFGAGTATMAPMVAGMGLGMMGATGAARVVGLADPFATGFSAIGNVMSGKPGALIGGAAAVAGAYGASRVIGGTADYIRGQMLEGQRNFLATRSLMRTMPQVGFGSQSVLSPTRMPLSTPQQVSQLNANMRAIGSDFGMTAGQSRNMMGMLGGMGMINTGSVRQMSSSFRSALSEMKSIAQQIGGDIQEAINVYKSIDQMGFKTSSSRRHVLRQMTTTSAMTGTSLGDVQSNMHTAMAAADQLGISRQTAADLATRSMQTTAFMSRTGALSSQYVDRMGGMMGTAQRMAQIQMGMAQSRGGLAAISNMFNPYGGIDEGGMRAALQGKSSTLRMARLRQMDPYAMNDVMDDAMGMMGGVVLARVGAINAKFGGSDPLRARREQFKYLQSMGISDAQEQMQYLSFLRSQPRAEFMGSLQDMRNTALTARDTSMSKVTSVADTYKNVIERINSSLSTTFQRAGEALLRNFEDTNRRVSTALYGRQRTYGTGNMDMGAMRAVSAQVMRGDFDFTASGSDLMSLVQNPATMAALNNNVNVRGVDVAARRQILNSTMARGMYAVGSLSGGLNKAIDNIAETLLNQSSSGRIRTPVGSLAEAMAGDVGAGGPINFGTDLFGRTRSGNAGQYLQAIARDMGAEFDPTTGSIVRLNQRQMGMLAATKGDDFRRAFNAGLGKDVRDQLSIMENERFATGAGLAGAALGGFSGFAAGGLRGGLPSAIVGGLGGAALGYAGGSRIAGTTQPESSGLLDAAATGISVLGGAYTGAKLGAMGGSFFGPVGSTIGGIAGAGIGGLVGFYYGSQETSLKDSLDEYSASTGVAEQVNLSQGNIDSLRRNKGALLSQRGNQLAEILFGPGKTMDTLSRQQSLQMDEMLRRFGGDIGKALAGKSGQSNITNEQFLSMAYQEVGGAIAEDALGIGASGPARVLDEQRQQGAYFSGSALGTYDLPTMRYGVDGTGNKRIRDLMLRLRKEGTQISDLLRSSGNRITLDTISQEIERLGKGGVDSAVLADIKSEAQGIFEAAARGDSDLSQFIKGSQGALTLSPFAAFQTAVGGDVLSSRFIEDGQLRPEMLGRASGVLTALSELGTTGTGTSSEITKEAVTNAIRRVSGQQFFSKDRKMTALGTLIGQYGHVSGQQSMRPDELISQLVSDNVLSEDLAASLRSDPNAFGALNNAGAVLEALQSGGSELAQQLGEAARSTAAANMGSAQMAFQGAQNNLVRGAMRQARRRRSADFRSTVAVLRTEGLGLSGEKVGRLEEHIKAAEASGQDVLSYLAEKAPAALEEISAELTNVRAGMSGPGTKHQREILSAAQQRIEGFKGMIAGDDDFSALSRMAIEGGISRRGGKLSLNKAAIREGFMSIGAMSPEKVSAILSGDQIGAMEKLLSGKRRGQQEVMSLLSDVAGARGMTGQAKMRQVVGAFSEGGTQGMSDADIQGQYNNMVNQLRTPKGTAEFLDGFERVLDRTFKANFGDEERTRAGEKDKQATMAEAIIGLKKAFDSVSSGGALRVIVAGGKIDNKAGTGGAGPEGATPLGPS